MLWCIIALYFPLTIQAQFTVTFETNGGSPLTPLNNVTVITTEPVTIRDGSFLFDGWFTTPDFTDIRVVFPYTVTQNITLFAKWNVPMIFAACAATHEVAILDNELNLWGTFIAGYPGLEDYCLPVGLGIYNSKIMVIDAVMQGLFSYNFANNPPNSVGAGDNLGSQPNQIIVDGDYGYVIISGTNTVKVLDLSANSTFFGEQRTVTTIPARLGSGTESTNPTFGTMLGDKLYISLTGITGLTGGNKLLEIAVRNINTSIPPSTPQILATRELAFLPEELLKDPGAPENYPSPAGICSANGKLYVVLGNLGVVGYLPVPVGPGYLAVIDTLTWTKTLHQLPDGCRNPRHVLVTDTLIYVSCAGFYGQGDPTEALVVLDALSMEVVNITIFPDCLPNGTNSGPYTVTPAAPGRMTILGNKLIIADEMTNRLFVTDLNGNIISELNEGIKICNFEYYSPTYCSQSIMDIVSVFISVDSISSVPLNATVSTGLILSSVVYPYYSTNKDIVWSINDTGTTGATITGNILNTTGTGIVTVTATIINGTAIGVNYTQDFTITVQPISVTNITDLPTTVKEGIPLELTGTVKPDNATNKTIIWEVEDDGTTGAIITDNLFLAEKEGTAKISATIKDGVLLGIDYSQEFSIIVSGVGISADNPNESNIKVYPNPASGVVHIKTSNGIISEIRLFSVDGRLLDTFYSSEIDMSPYSAGIYYLQAGGEKVKIIKK